jgi:predicted nucleic acid-binding protein
VKTTLVLDCSVVTKWFFDEEQTSLARALAPPTINAIAPDLLWAELGNVVWKRVQRSGISPEQAESILANFSRMQVGFVASADLMAAALKTAIETGRSFYDCLYLALAISRDCQLVTADERFINSLANTPLAKHVRLLASTK